MKSFFFGEFSQLSFERFSRTASRAQLTIRWGLLKTFPMRKKIHRLHLSDFGARSQTLAEIFLSLKVQTEYNEMSERIEYLLIHMELRM